MNYSQKPKILENPNVYYRWLMCRYYSNGFVPHMALNVFEFFELSPPAPKYEFIWDANIVLDF